MQKSVIPVIFLCLHSLDLLHHSLRFLISQPNRGVVPEVGSALHSYSPSQWCSTLFQPSRADHASRSCKKLSGKSGATWTSLFILKKPLTAQTLSGVRFWGPLFQKIMISLFFQEEDNSHIVLGSFRITKVGKDYKIIFVSQS